MQEQPRGTETVFASGRHLRLVCEDGWEFAERVGVSGVVAIVAVTEDGRLILTEQFRTPIGRRVIDLPAGLVGDASKQEAAVEAAQRELLEETGYRADQWTPLAEVPTSPGLSSEIVTLFLAAGLQQVGPGGGEGDESIHVHEVPLTEIHAWLNDVARDGCAIDLKVYAALYFVLDGSAKTQARIENG